MDRKTFNEAERVALTEQLRELIQKDDTIYCILRWYSKRSGTRIFDLILIRNNQPRSIGYWTAAALGVAWDRDRDGIVTGGWGMDFGMDLVQRLSHTLFNDSYALQCVHL